MHHWSKWHVLFLLSLGQANVASLLPASKRLKLTTPWKPSSGCTPYKGTCVSNCLVEFCSGRELDDSCKSVLLWREARWWPPVNSISECTLGDHARTVVNLVMVALLVWLALLISCLLQWLPTLHLTSHFLMDTYTM